MRTRVLAVAALPGLLLAFCCAASAADAVKFSVAKGAVPSTVVVGNGRGRIAMPANIAAAQKTHRALAGGGNAMRLPLSEMNTLVAVRDAAGNITVQHAADGEVIPNAVAPAAEAVQ